MVAMHDDGYYCAISINELPGCFTESVLATKAYTVAFLAITIDACERWSIIRLCMWLAQLRRVEHR